VAIEGKNFQMCVSVFRLFVKMTLIDGFIRPLPTSVDVRFRPASGSDSLLVLALFWCLALVGHR
jgi:hypothetical protein